METDINITPEKDNNLDNMTFMDKNVRINSPRSKRAIFILGVDEDKLYEINKEDYFKKNKDLENIPNVLKNKRYEKFNFRRLKAIDDARKIRNDIILAEKKQKNYNIFNIDELIKYSYNYKIDTSLIKQIKAMVQYELKLQENERKNGEKQAEIEENKKKIEEEKKEKDDIKKMELQILLDIIEKNQLENYERFKKKQEEIMLKEKERLKRFEIKKDSDLEEAKRLGLELKEKMKRAAEKREIQDEKREKKMMILYKKLTKTPEKVEEVEKWKKQEEYERHKNKIFLSNLQTEIEMRKKFEESWNINNQKILKMKKDKESILRNKSEILSSINKEKEQQALSNMKRNAEIEEIKIQNLIEKNKRTEKNVEKQKKINSIELNNKVIYSNLKRTDNMDNLRIFERKRSFERNKIMSNIYKRRNIAREIQMQKKNKIKNINRQMSSKRNIYMNKAHLALGSGKYRNASDIYSYIFTS